MKLLDSFCYGDGTKHFTPTDPKQPLRISTSTATSSEVTEMQRMIGSLEYLATITRLDHNIEGRERRHDIKTFRDELFSKTPEDIQRQAKQRVAAREGRAYLGASLAIDRLRGEVRGVVAERARLQHEVDQGADRIVFLRDQLKKCAGRSGL